MPVVRWPGGCFADEYHWRDGIGPRAQAPGRRSIRIWGGVTEPNSFGTHEFMDFAELIGADAYVAGNVGSRHAAGNGGVGRIHDLARRIDAGRASAARTAASSRGSCRIFGVGNETWGCGGNMRPEYYADLYRQLRHLRQAPRGNAPLIDRERRQRRRLSTGPKCMMRRPRQAHGRASRSITTRSDRQLGRTRAPPPASARTDWARDAAARAAHGRADHQA